MFPQQAFGYLSDAYLKYFLNPGPAFPVVPESRTPIQLYNPLESLQLYTSSQAIYSSSSSSAYVRDVSVEPTEQFLLDCPYCDFTCDKESTMTRHKEEQHNCLLTCEDCTFTTADQTEMNEHMRTRHTNNTFLSCCICNQQFYGKEYLAKHFQNHFESGQNHLALELAMVEKKSYASSIKKSLHSQGQSSPYQIPSVPSMRKNNRANDKTGCFKIPEAKNKKGKLGMEQWVCPICDFKARQESVLLEHVQKIHLAETSCAVVGIRAKSDCCDNSRKQH